jgi:citrate synthase
VPDFLTAQEAALRLGVSRQTLYAYVSRGLLRAHDADDPRQSRYATDAVAALARERRRGRQPREVAKATLDFGMPVLESAITLIQGGRLFYRGIDAVALAADASVEAVAALLWDLPEGAAFGPNPPSFAIAATTDDPSGEALLPRFAAAAHDDSTASWRTDDRRLAEGCGQLIRLMLACVTGVAPTAAPLHEQLARAWGLDEAGAHLMRTALVLCADHELNASNFTARCVASTGASLRSAVIGGLAALSGPRHGGATFRAESLWRVLEAGPLPALLRRHLAAGEEVPAFGHPLYPEGDPRAAALLARILPRFPAARAMIEEIVSMTGIEPNIDFALITLRRFLGLPEGHAFQIFALGRTVGWIAHAIEQRRTGQLIRPRAVYTGRAPATDR